MRIRTIVRTTRTSSALALGAAVLAACVGLAGCSSGSADTGAAKEDTQQVAVGLKTAEQVATAVEQSVSSMTTTVEYTAATDPDHLLGKPNGYLSKVAFTDSRVQSADVEGTKPDAVARGGCVETFATAAQARARAKAIEQGSEGSVSAGEYHYVIGTSLLRVSQVLTTAQAEDYALAARTLT